MRRRYTLMLMAAVFVLLSAAASAAGGITLFDADLDTNGNNISDVKTVFSGFDGASADLQSRDGFVVGNNASRWSQLNWNDDGGFNSQGQVSMGVEAGSLGFPGSTWNAFQIHRAGNLTLASGGDSGVTLDATGIAGSGGDVDILTSGSLDMNGNPVSDVGDVNPTGTPLSISAGETTYSGDINLSGNNMTDVYRVSGEEGEIEFSDGSRMHIQAGTIDFELRDGTGDTLRLNMGNTIQAFAPLDVNGNELRTVETVTTGAGPMAVQGNVSATTTIQDIADLQTTTLPTCDATYEGEIRYNGTHHVGCDATAWNALY